MGANEKKMSIFQTVKRGNTHFLFSSGVDYMIKVHIFKGKKH